MELDQVEGKALRVEAAQLRGIVVGETPELEGLGAAGGGAEGGQFLMARRRAAAPHRLPQGRVSAQEVHTLERRTQVGALVGREAGAGHGSLLSLRRPQSLLRKTLASFLASNSVRSGRLV